MGYERYRQGQRDPRDFGADSNDTYSSARDYEAAGYYDRGQRDYGRGDYGRSEHGQRFDQRPSGYSGNDVWNDRGRSQQGYGPSQQRSGQSEPYRGSYASDGHRFTDIEDAGRNRFRDDNRSGYGQSNYGRSDYGRQPQGYDYEERGFLNRAGDEVRSWFGDDDAARRRDQDARLDQRYNNDRDADYHGWRSGQIAALDRDYDEYRKENRSKFENEFSSWRTERQGQRSSLAQVQEHQDVVGSDGSHVGTVDKVRGDRIVLTKNDQDAGGRHHSIPSRWIDTVADGKVTLRKTAEEAKNAWRDEERKQAFFGDDQDRDRGSRQIGDDRGAHGLNRSFSGTY